MAVGALLLPFHVLFLFLFLFSFSSPMASSAIPESEALLQFKKSFDDTTALDSWRPKSKPCDGNETWAGLRCYDNIIIGVQLESMGLSGKVNVGPLVHIPGLRTLSFINNSLSGPIPEVNRLSALKAIYLSANQFSGEIPADFFAKMVSLKKLWLSDNNLTGEIPTSIAQLPRLIELHLENNQFTGNIPSFSQPKLTSLDLSNNRLEGKIPDSLLKFNTSSFTGNSGLCGEKVSRACEETAEQPNPLGPAEVKQSNKAAATLMTVAAVIFTLVVAAIVVLKRKEEKKFDVLENEAFDESVEVHVSGSSRKDTDMSGKSMGLKLRGSSNLSKGRRSGSVAELVMVNEAKGVFGLLDLMKAGAEVLGNSSLGSSYKALMHNGLEVVVKRIKEMNAMERDGFDTEMRRLGRLRHQNVLTSLAYHNRKDEKLLIHEYLLKGSLLYLLHGDRGPSHAKLDWPTRLKIIHGIARGLCYLHEELAPFDLPHGNLKSSNVILAADYEPLLVDYGLGPLLNPNQAAVTLFAYKSPEAIQTRRVSPSCDVYCLGIISLEILSGKFPSQYSTHGNGGSDLVQWAASAISEGKESEFFDPEIARSRTCVVQMGRLLRIGAACTESDPQRRLGMREAIQRIEDIYIE